MTRLGLPLFHELVASNPNGTFQTLGSFPPLPGTSGLPTYFGTATASGVTLDANGQPVANPPGTVTVSVAGVERTSGTNVASCFCSGTTTLQHP